MTIMPNFRWTELCFCALWQDVVNLVGSGDASELEAAANSLDVDIERLKGVEPMTAPIWKTIERYYNMAAVLRAAANRNVEDV